MNVFDANPDLQSFDSNLHLADHIKSSLVNITLQLSQCGRIEFTTISQQLNDLIFLVFHFFVEISSPIKKVFNETGRLL